MPYADEELERLLANDRLSGRAYDQIEERVMRTVLARAPAARSSRIWIAVLPAVAALGGLALYFGIASGERSAADGFTAKGVDSPLAGAVELRCSTERACRVGDTLLFLVDTDVAHGYLNASAQRIEPASTERIRFFPSQSGRSPHVPAAGGTVVVEQGVRLGESLGPGLYRVDVRWTDDAPSADPTAGHGVSLELRVDEQ